MDQHRRAILKAALAAGLIALAAPAAAHHGLMLWDTKNVVTIEGVVSEELDGFPHWEVSVRVDTEDWVIDMGSDFELEHAGFHPDGREFTIGAKIKVEGFRPRDADDSSRLLRPLRITLDGKVYQFSETPE